MASLLATFIASAPAKLGVPQEARPTYGSIIGIKGQGQTMKVHAFLGIDPVIIVGSTDLQWQTVEVAFSGGKVESAVAEYSSLAVVTARDKTYVGIGDLSGSGNTYPSGLAMTVTFSSDTDMDDVKINFHSPITAITTNDQATYPTVAFSHLPNGYVASIVQDTQLDLYVFAPSIEINTVELSVSNMADMKITPLIDHLRAIQGNDKFGLAFLDGVHRSIGIAQAVPIASCTEALTPSAGGATWVSILSDETLSPSIEYLTVIVGAIFDPPPSMPANSCESCGVSTPSPSPPQEASLPLPSPSPPPGASPPSSDANNDGANLGDVPSTPAASVTLEAEGEDDGSGRPGIAVITGSSAIAAVLVTLLVALTVWGKKLSLPKEGPQVSKASTSKDEAPQSA